MNDATEKWIRVLVSPDEIGGFKLTARQKEIFDVVSDMGAVSLKELCYFTGVSLSVVNALILGEQGQVSTSVETLYRALGLTHILSVSGFHIALITLLIYQLIL